MPRFSPINRSIEPHTECMVYTYLQDANGAPVPGVKIKLWGGPPPYGEPPYFVDDDPNSPNRRTDANGKFQFVAAGGPVTNRSDYFVVALDGNNQPMSDRIQFTFLPGQAAWITVTLAEERAEGEGEGESRAAAGGEAAEPPANSTLRGKIAGAVAKAGVALTGPAGSHLTMVDEAGNYELAGIAAGTYTLSVVGIGTVASNLELDGTNALVFDYTPPPSRSVVRGTVTNALSGTQVTLAGTAGSRVTSVDAFGGYNFINLPEGTYSVGLSGIGQIREHIVLDGTNQVVVNYTIQPQAPGPITFKIVEHYVLFGSAGAPGTMTNLILALDYLSKFAPAAGFKVEEAQYAKHVTIVGDISAISPADEKKLREAGCQINRLTAADSYGLEKIFQKLVASDSPFGN